MSRLVNLFCLEAVLEAEQEHPHEAMESLRRAAIIGNTLKNDIVIHFLTKATAQSKIALALQRVLNRANPTAADLASLANFLSFTNIGVTRESWIINQVPLALLMAGFMQSNVSQMTEGVIFPPRRLLKSFEGEILYHDEDLLQYLDWQADCLAALDLPVSNAIPMLRNMETLQDEAAQHRHVYLDVFKKRRFSLLSVEEAQFSGAFLGELKTVAEVRVALTALAVERWRSAHGGRLPGSLTELAPNFLPAIPADPFDRRPLRYKQLPKGFVIYSIGPDFTDDGGKEEESKEPKSDEYDITFTVDK
jgi:hypothetical protein